MFNYIYFKYKYQFLFIKKRIYATLKKGVCMDKIELLAPAGNMECLKAAIHNGADAIYIGGSNFSARAYADNFTNEQIVEAIKYAHIYGVKIYVSVNITIYDDEINDVINFIDFLYLNGNHDKEGSLIEKDISNLQVFSKEAITTYQYDNISISGIEITPSNSNVFYSRINLNEDNINIFMLHGEISSSSGMDKIKLESLKNKNIDYLALGHIHKRDEGKIDERGIYVYPGNLEPRGFDECGEKGFVVLDITDKISHTFIPFSKRTIHEVVVDVTGVQSSFDILMKAKEKVKDIPYQDILRIRLVGELPLNVEVDEREIEVGLSSYFFVNVKNETTSSLDPSKYDNDKSLIGEFIRGVYENKTYSDEEKQKIVAMGLRVISGKEIE